MLNNSFAGDAMVEPHNTLVTASHAIFHKEDNKEAPVAVVGYQFHHSALLGLFKNITTNVSTLQHLRMKLWMVWTIAKIALILFHFVL